jgi:hypothetical protein
VEKNKVSNYSSTIGVSTYYHFGGLVGYNLYEGMILNCYATGEVSGDWYTGGLVGTNDGTVSNCYAAAGVSGNNDTAGLVGHNCHGTISNGYATGESSGDWYTGGLAGHNCYGTISNCYATGTVDGNHYTGGLVGSSGGTVSASFWDIETGGPNNGIGTPKTTAEMKTKRTFTDAGWDFVGETINGPNDYWRMCVDSVNYPLLSWQFVPDFVCPDGVDFRDFAFFANHWMYDNCGGSNDCGGTDLDFSDTVDANDLKIFCDHWLEGM